MNFVSASADLEVQLMQLNHCDGVLSNDWNTLLGQQISQHTAMSMSRSALEIYFLFYVLLLGLRTSFIYIDYL